MRTSIIGPTIRLNETLRRAAERRVNVVLRRILTRIDHVSITLTDVNAIKGGVDKQCRVKVTVRGIGTVTAEGRHEDELGSIDKALRRARRVILKRLKRRVTRSRKQPAVYVDSNSGLDIALAN